MSDTDRLRQAFMDTVAARALAFIRFTDARDRMAEASDEYNRWANIHFDAEKAERDAREAYDTALYEEARS